MTEINFPEIEKKWQDKWESEKAFEVKKDSEKKKYYILEMFPYPSGTGLHMGHAFNYTIGDILARFKTMKGFNVLHPMGYDALGLPAENAAIKVGTHPEKYTNDAIANYKKQQKALGISYDWSRVINTASPDYYKWDQWIFLKMLEKGLAYQKTSAVNWCKKCNTVLANEQVENGKCWRHDDTDVEIKHLKQWFLKTTEYADELYENLDDMNWPERTKAMQKNWIGKSHGLEIDFEVENIKNKEFVFFHAYKDNSKSVFWNKLKEAIKFHGGKVVYAPDLPGGDAPKIEEQVDYVLGAHKFSENTIIISHSLGNLLAMKLIPKLKNKIDRLIMVAPPIRAEFKDGRSRPLLENCCDFDFDFNSIKEKTRKIDIISDLNDHIVPESHAKELAKELNASLTETIGNKTHFNGEEEPEIEKVLFNTWPIFTTRPDTIFGVTFMVVSAQHPRLNELVTDEQKVDVDKFLKKVKSVSEKDAGDLEKEGVFTGSYAINPATGEKIPIWVGNFVIADYGSGMVMAVPAHDKRDFDFANKYGIEIKQVISGGNIKNSAFVDDGVLINSKQFNKLNNQEAKEKIADWLIKKNLARKVVNFKLRDWGISRQRYWGTPIPIVYCDKCGVVPIPEKDLPVELPKNVKFGEGNPLETAKDWINVKCPKCGEMAKRETDTMDTFVNSSWYFLRYCDPHNDNKIFGEEKANYWCPIDTYIGGAEHACMHLIYSRFYVKFLRDLGLINFDEPAIRLFHQGMLHAEDGRKMSKSLGNVIDPLKTAKQYSVDAVRFFIVSVASPDKDFDWSKKEIAGSFRFIKKIADIYENIKIGVDNKEIISILNQSVRDTAKQFDNFDYRSATIVLRNLFDLLSTQKEASKETLGNALKILNPICPHITEELWEKLGNKNLISTSEWPKFDESKIIGNNKMVDLTEKIIKNVKYVLGKIKTATTIYIYVMPFELKKIDIKRIENEIGKKIKLFAVDNPEKYDPDGKAKKAKPGKPGIYVE